MSIHDRPLRRGDKKFLERVEAIAAFRSEHGRLPSGRAKDPSERVLGGWLSNVRTTHRGNTGRGPNLNPQRVQALDDHLPGWQDVLPGNVADEGTFAARLRKVKAFLDTNGRLPRATSGECEGLGAWLTRVKAAARGKGNMAWTAERESAVRDALPGWLEGDQR